MTNTTDAQNVSIEEKKEPQALELHLEMILLFSAMSPDTGQEKKADKLRHKGGNSSTTSDEEEEEEIIRVKRLSNAYISSHAVINDSIQESDTVKKESKQININELNLEGKRIQTEVLKVKSVLDGYYNRYSKVYLHIIVPSDNEMSVTSSFFLKELFDEDFINHYSPLLDASKSEINFLYFAGNPAMQSSDGSNEAASERPTDNDAKIAAVMSHYVYFYLDWLEYVQYHCKSIKKYQASNESVDDEFPYISSTDSSGSGLTTDGLLSLPNGEKIKLRIVNRLKEIATVSGLEQSRWTVTLGQILEKCRTQGRPIEFYELYDAFGYWNHVGKYLGEEAKKWYVSHPSVVAENDQKGMAYHRFLFIKWKKGKVLTIGIDKLTGRPLVYNSVLTHGMSWLSGYGGLLFVKLNSADTVDDAQAIKMAYCTKGTDVNSLNDWVMADLLQAFTGFSLQHVHTIKNAITLDKKVRKFNSKLPMFFCGHSLGGGLASSNAIVAKGRHAITFNAAGLNFIGALATRIVGAIANANLGALSPTGIAKRVHPFRIKGEIVDVLMILGRGPTAMLNERAYGSAPYIIDFKGFPLSETAGKHGINNFLAKPMISQLRIVDKTTTSQPVGNISKITLKDVIDYKGEFIFMTQDITPLKKYAQEATKQKKKEQQQHQYATH